MIAEILFVVISISLVCSDKGSIRLFCNCETPVMCHTSGYFGEIFDGKTKIIFNGCDKLESSEVSDLRFSFALKGIKRSFHEFKNVKALQITGSHIKLPMSDLFNRLHQMGKLVLNQNGIKELTAFPQLWNLRKLFLASNKLEVISKKLFCNLPVLELLTLEDNKIFFIHAEAFARNEKLEEINLNRNELNFMEPTMFHYNPNLKEVSLNHNKIRRLPIEAFVKNFKLEVLRIFGNKLESLEKDIFVSNLNLRWIELGSNELLFFDSKVFQTLHQLQFVDLSFNSCIDGSFPIEMDYEHLNELIKRNCHYLAVLNNGIL